MQVASDGPHQASFPLPSQRGAFGQQMRSLFVWARRTNPFPLQHPTSGLPVQYVEVIHSEISDSKVGRDRCRAPSGGQEDEHAPVGVQREQQVDVLQKSLA